MTDELRIDLVNIILKVCIGKKRSAQTSSMLQTRIRQKLSGFTLRSILTLRHRIRQKQKPGACIIIIITVLLLLLRVRRKIQNFGLAPFSFFLHLFLYHN